ncbi:MAG: hypothetical protein Q4E73_02430 [Lachnospiraceae bacterium]|nr:hypothetical protein [Lachnospiraceae bacterium]
MNVALCRVFVQLAVRILYTGAQADGLCRMLSMNTGTKEACLHLCLFMGKLCAPSVAKIRPTVQTQCVLGGLFEKDELLMLYLCSITPAE